MKNAYLFFLATIFIVACTLENSNSEQLLNSGNHDQASIINLPTAVNNNTSAQFNVVSSLNEFKPKKEEDSPVINLNGVWVEISELAETGSMVCIDISINNLDTQKEFISTDFLVKMEGKSTTIFLPEFILNGEVENNMDQLSTFVLEGQRICEKKYKDKVPKLKLKITIKDSAIKEQIVELI